VAERKLIEYIRSLAGQELPAWLPVGIGDDAAVVEVAGGGRIVVTTDTVIEAVHFETGTAPSAIGRKAMARGLSDIAAMGVRPTCTVAAVNFGTWSDEATCQALVEALWQAAAEFGGPLVGGDVASSDGPLSIVVTALGSAGTKGVVTRSGAQVGDAVCVTGRLGGSLLGRHLTFSPRIQEALALVDAADVHAMIDISDGLSTDGLHVAQASGVALELQGAGIPVSEDAVALASASGKPALWHALNDGEDYELLFCVAQHDAERLAESGLLDVPVAVIGKVMPPGESVLVLPEGRRVPLVSGGWEHMA